MAEDKTTSLISGMIIGAALGAGLAFLFGTEKGAKVRREIRDKNPELFDRIDGVVEEMKNEAVDNVKKVSKKVPLLTVKKTSKKA